MMKIKQNMELLLWLWRSKSNADGRAPIYVRITIDGKLKEISIGEKVFPSHWDNDRKRVTNEEPRHKAINSVLMQAEVDLDRHFMALQSQVERVTSDMVKKAYLGKTAIAKPVINTKEGKDTILYAFGEFIERFEKMVDKGVRSFETLKHWRTTKKKVQAFLVHKYKVKDLPLTEIEPSFGDEFYDYLTLDVKVPLAEPTAKKHIKNTKQIIKTGVRKKLIAANPIEDFKCGGGETEIPPLEFHQVDAIYNKDFGIELSVPHISDSY